MGPPPPRPCPSLSQDVLRTCPGLVDTRGSVVGPAAGGQPPPPPARPAPPVPASDLHDALHCLLVWRLEPEPAHSLELLFRWVVDVHPESWSRVGVQALQEGSNPQI